MTNSQIISRLIPGLLSDDQFLAVVKPPRVDLSEAVHKRGRMLIDLVAARSSEPTDVAHDTGPPASGGEAQTPIPLMLPTRQASGVALFARTDEARRRFEGMAETGKVSYQYVVVAGGKPVRGKLKIQGTDVRCELIGSGEELMIIRVSTAAPSFDLLGRQLRSCGLRVLGDVAPEARSRSTKSARPRRLMAHLEQVSLPHPFERHRLHLVAPIPKSFRTCLAGSPMIDDHLHTAAANRLACILDEATDSFRLFTGTPEGIPGLAVDKFGPTVLLQPLQGKFQGREPLLRQVANWYAANLGIETVYSRVLPIRRDDPKRSQTGEQSLVAHLKGPPVDECVVTENGLRFIVTPGAGSGAGLFLDHRENRRRLAKLSQGKRVLNLFAYTCGFSVAAAAGGAASVTSVDLAVRNLEWGKRNFAANGIELDDRLTFICSDAFDYFKRATRQKKSFDVIAIDPPTFSRTAKPKRTFEIRKDLVRLLAGAISILGPGGHLLVATNNRQLSVKWLVDQVSQAAENRRVEIVARPRLPIDFATDPEHQKTIIARLA